MEKLLRHTTRIALIGAVAVLTSACWPGDDPEPVADVMPVEDLFPKVFAATDQDAFIAEFQPRLIELQRTGREEFTAVARGMAQIIRFSDLSVTAEDLREGLPELEPFADLPDPSSQEFLGLFHEAVLDRLADGGVTFESIKTMGAAHQENAGTTYRNAMYLYLEELREKRRELRKRDDKLRKLVDLVSFIQPVIRRDGTSLHVTVQTRNGTDQALNALSVTVGEKNPERSWEAAKSVGETVVRFDQPFGSDESRALSFSVEAGEYTGGPISLEVTGVTTSAGFSVEKGAMDEPMKLLDKLISDVEWEREQVRDTLQRALERFPR
ncbi:hypothetical protein [Roseivivax sp. CAU 1761]